MYKADQLVYIHMQKTGGTHIVSLLDDLLDGEQADGKHIPATQEQVLSNNYFVSSIRNPWDWYLSLWTFGVQGNGALMKRLTLTKTRRLRNTFRSTLKNPRKYHKKLIKNSLRKLTGETDLWRKLYDSSDDVQSFRKWLKLIHHTSYTETLGEGYGKTAVTDFCGYMTYRYLYLSCRNLNNLRNPDLISDFTDLVMFEKKNCYIDYFIRQESLEKDFCYAIENIQNLSQEEKKLIRESKKTNTSERAYSLSDYYDEESIELIYNREKLIIDKFNYSPPCKTSKV